MRVLAHREPTFALHVHVGVPDPVRAVRALDGIREHLPLLLALSADSSTWSDTASTSSCVACTCCSTCALWAFSVSRSLWRLNAEIARPAATRNSRTQGTIQCHGCRRCGSG